MELHARNEISQLVPESKLLSCATFNGSSLKNKEGTTLQKRLHFRLCGIDFYPAVTGNEIPTILNYGYDYLFLDAGTLDEDAFDEFLRCDRKLILGSLAPWKCWKYESFFQKFENTINLGEGFDYLVRTGTKEEIFRFSKAHHIKMQVVPFIKNPFSIEKELFPFLGTLSAELLSCSDRL